jgi:hypothetical protein
VGHILHISENWFFKLRLQRHVYFSRICRQRWLRVLSPPRLKHLKSHSRIVNKILIARHPPRLTLRILLERQLFLFQLLRLLQQFFAFMTALLRGIIEQHF